MIEMNDCAVEALLEFLLQLVVVADGVAVLDATDPADHARLVEHRLDQRGLAGAGSANQGQVANVTGRVVGHARILLAATTAPRASWIEITPPASPA